MRQRLLLSALMITLLGTACDDDEPLAPKDAAADAPKADATVDGTPPKPDVVAETGGDVPKTDTTPNLDVSGDATDAKVDATDAAPDSADAGADALDASEVGG